MTTLKGATGTLSPLGNFSSGLGHGVTGATTLPRPGNWLRPAGLRLGHSVVRVRLYCQAKWGATVPIVTSPPARRMNGLCRGRPGPEPAGWTGAVVPSPPPPCTETPISLIRSMSVACYRRASLDSSKKPTQRGRSTMDPSVPAASASLSGSRTSLRTREIG